MTLHTWPDVEQGSPEWHDLRRGICTASTVGKLLTPTLKTADNDTSRALVTTLAAERITGFTEETPTNSDMWRGTLSEPYARDIYSGLYQQAVPYGFMRLDGPGWSLGLSPDGLVGDEGGIEIKSPRAKTHLRTILADEVPTHYMAQVQAALFVTGRDWWDWVSYCGGMPLYVKRVTPDMKWASAILGAIRKAEEDIAALVADYRARTNGLPNTERLDLSLEVI